MLRILSLFVLLISLVPLSADNRVYPFAGCAPLTVPDTYKNINWFLWPEKTGEKDGLFTSLTNHLTTCSRYHDSIPFILSSALSHHLLYRLGRDSSFTGFTEKIRILESRGYSGITIQLLKAAQSIITGDLKNGFSAIDGIQNANTPANNAISKDILYILAYCFVPVTTFHHMSIGDTLPLVRDTDPRLFGTIPLGEKETTPEYLKWSLHEAYHPALPSGVSLSVRFNLTTTPTLQIPFLYPVRKRFLATTADSGMLNKVIDWTVADPFNTTAPMELSVAVYPGMHKTPLDEFMYTVIAGNFDRVRKVKTLSRFKALSVRCRTYKLTSAGGSRYSAFILFDACISSTGKSIRMLTTGTITGKEILPVRYLLSMRADRNVEQKAEQILSNIVNLFEQRL